MLTISFDRCPLKPLRVATLEEPLNGMIDRNRFAGNRVGAVLNRNLDARLRSICRALPIT